MQIFRMEEINGRLLSVEPDEKSRYEFIVWFPYTQELIRCLQDGDLLAVPNFQTNKERVVYSILKITNILPKHFALRGKEDTRSYPGYVLEAAKNIASSWLLQEKEPLEDTTIIEISAIPTNLQFYINDDGEPVIEEERSLPMVGEETKLLSSEFTEMIINGTLKFDELAIQIGHLVRDENIKVLLKIDELIKTHFGVFGFTGVGKSNLLSTLISKILLKAVEKRIPIKILLFDLTDEYTSILIDILSKDSINAKIIYLGRNSLPKTTFEFLNGLSHEKDKAVESYISQVFIQKKLRIYREEYKNAIEYIFERGIIKIFEEIPYTIKEALEDYWWELKEGLKSPLKLQLIDSLKNEIYKAIEREYSTPNPELTEEIIDFLINILNSGENFKKFSLSSLEKIKKGYQEIKDRIDIVLIPRLKLLKDAIKEKLFEKLSIDIKTIIEDLNDNSISSLYLITSGDPDLVREFAYRIGMEIYDIRRRYGKTEPLILFVFDEADEIIPQEQRISVSSQKLSKRVVEMIARRGRKFGIGVGLATQRSSYLDTNIMGQLHTYFISKLPREYDRKVVGEAFGLPESEFIQTFKFRKGEWLLVSHDATGIESIPFPIYIENAEERVKQFLIQKKSNNKQ